MRKPITLSVLSVALLSACAVGPDYQRPTYDLPQEWTAAEAGVPTPQATDPQWWKLFADPTLDALVEEAFAHNTDLEQAVARVDEARALLGVARADLYPSLNANAAASRNRASQSSATALPGFSPLFNDYSASIGVAYELDLWGKFRRATEAARADLLGSEAARDTVRISLAAQVAQGYFSLLALDAQLTVTRRTLQARVETLDLQRKRYDSGVLSEFELRQQEAEVATSRAQVPVLERLRAQQENALAVLLGRSPRAIVEEKMARGNVQTPPLVVPSDLPSDLLLRRPDIQEAEQSLIAANARIGQARAAYFPSISLTGFFGSESGALADLFSGPARTFQFAGSLAQPIFQGGRIRGQVEAAEARQRQALAFYRAAVASAFRDVQDALVAQSKAKEALDAETTRVSALRSSLVLAQQRYDNGISSQLDVLDSERNLLAAELERLDAERSQRTAVADLFKALGGGWEVAGSSQAAAR